MPTTVDFQEFMIMPVGAPSFAEALRCGAEIFHTLKKVAARGGLATAVGDEGGFAPEPRLDPRGARLHHEAIEKAGYKAGDDVVLALDCAATEFFKDGAYAWKGEGKTPLARRDGRLPRRALRRLSDPSRSRTAWPKTIWPAGRR